jgi:hypothetical protein
MRVGHGKRAKRKLSPPAGGSVIPSVHAGIDPSALPARFAPKGVSAVFSRFALSAEFAAFDRIDIPTPNAAAPQLPKMLDCLLFIAQLPLCFKNFKIYLATMCGAE